MGYVAAGTAALGAYQAYEQNKANNKAAESAQDSAIEQSAQMQAQNKFKAEQEANATKEQITQRKRLSNVQEADLINSQVESGVSGISSLREQANIGIQEMFDVGSIKSFGQSTQGTIALQSKSNELQTKNVVNRAQAQKTSGLQSVLGITSGAISGGTTGYSIDKNLGTTF